MMSVRERVQRVLLATQFVFFLALACCVLLVHDYAVENAGISYYGVHARTIAFAIIGYLAAALGLWLASSLIRAAGSVPILWVGLRLVAVMLILLLLTPYSGGTFLNWAHMTVGVVGALVQLAMSWSLVRRRRDWRVVSAFVIQFLGGVVGALSLPDWRFQALLVGETVFQLGFSWSLLEWTSLVGEGRRVFSPGLPEVAE